MNVRDAFAKAAAGGPQYHLQPDKIIVEVNGGTTLSEISDIATEDGPNFLDGYPVGEEVMESVSSKLESLNLNTQSLNHFGVIVAKADNVSDVVNRIQEERDEFRTDTVESVENLVTRAKNNSDRTILGGFGDGTFNFGDSNVVDLEANIRNELSSDGIRNAVTDALTDLDGVLNAEMAHTWNTPGPQNLGLEPEDMPNVPFDEGGDGGESKLENSDRDVGDAIEKMGVKKAWEENKGDGAVIAIFDTSFCKEYFDEDRVLDTFHGDDVDSAFSKPEEGHGTMTAYSAGGNKGESGLPFNGVAPEADLLLARVSGKGGALNHTHEAWEWLVSWVQSLDRPVFSNHSYGVPMCSARGMGMCNSSTTKMARVMNQRDDHQGFFAAGNEGMYCGHRLSGVTNGINSTNSDPTSITVGALRFDLRGAQKYSSHGFGTCSGIDENPKPDVSSLIPSVVPYGCNLKDMGNSTGGSSGGTSEATPIVCGVGALMGTVTGNAKRSEIESIMETTAELPRKTQINVFRGYDARYGNGQVRADEAVSQLAAFKPENAPHAIFAATPQNVVTDELIEFDATATTDPDGDIDSYEWDFGDGSSASGKTVRHSYGISGTYEVTLTVEDSYNNTATHSKTVTVEKPEPEPEPEPEPNPDAPTEGEDAGNTDGTTGDNNSDTTDENNNDKDNTTEGDVDGGTGGTTDDTTEDNTGTDAGGTGDSTGGETGDTGEDTEGTNTETAQNDGLFPIFR